MANSDLTKAKNAKNDEFILNTLTYKRSNGLPEYNSDVFRGKTILLPCDDPEWSNFTRVPKILNVSELKLISTSYAPDSKSIKQLSADTL